jgi:hypothetical protein
MYKDLVQDEPRTLKMRIRCQLLRIFNSRNFTTMSRMALGPTQPPIQWVPGALSLGVKRLG